LKELTLSIFNNVISKLFNKNTAASDEASLESTVAFDFEDWNRIGREKAKRVCIGLEDAIDREIDTDEDFTDDERSEEFADAVLEKVETLNNEGQWQQARARFDPAYAPYDSHLGDLGLHAVVILGPERFLVRLGDEVLHMNGSEIIPVEGASMFAISCNRGWLVFATDKGLEVSTGFDAETRQTIAWPEGIEVDPSTILSLGIADDGISIVLASDSFGIWIVKQGMWTALAPRAGVGDEEDDDVDTQAQVLESHVKANKDEPLKDDGVRNFGDETCPVYFGSYADIKAKFGGPLGIDNTHVAISPDGQYLAYGWQDAWGGHYVDRVTGKGIEPYGRIQPISDYPYHVRFTNDSQKVLSNSRHLYSGVTVCRDLATLALETGDAPSADEFLRAFGMTLLPGSPFGLDEPVAWIGGAGWSHAVPLSGGKPVFTHFLGSALRSFDFDPVSQRVAIASASGILHVLDPFCESEEGRERGYHPRRELFRWIFWETLDAPIRW
jgi:hypothetical protein